MNRDSQLECMSCGFKTKVSFAESLKHGWLKCCGYTMKLTKTNANIDKIVTGIVNDSIKKAVVTYGVNEKK